MLAHGVYKVRVGVRDIKGLQCKSVASSWCL